MREEDITFHGLDELEAAFRPLCNDITYLILHDHTDATAMRIGRFNLDEDELRLLLPAGQREEAAASRPYPADEPASDDDDEADDEDEDDGEDNDGDAEEEGRSALRQAVKEPVTPLVLLEAAFRAVQTCVRANMRGSEVRKFRARAYGVKGHALITSGTFIAHNRAWQPTYTPRELPAPGPVPPPITPAAVLTPNSGASDVVNSSETGNSSLTPAPATNGASSIPAPAVGLVPLTPGKAQAVVVASAPPPVQVLEPTLNDQMMTGAARAYRQLGDCYTQFTDLVLSSMSQVQAVVTSSNRDLSAQARESREQVDTLVASVVELRAKELDNAAAGQQAASQEQRTLLARDAINQVGEAARAFFVSRGSSPPVADLMVHVSSSPELLAALQEPGVQDMLRDPGMLSGLAQLLRQVGQQRMQARGGSSAQATAPMPPAQAPLQPPVPGQPGMWTEAVGSGTPAMNQGGFPAAQAGYGWTAQAGGPSNNGFPPPTGPLPAGYGMGLPGASSGASPMPSFPPNAHGSYPYPGYPTHQAMPQPGWSHPMPTPAGYSAQAPAQQAWSQPPQPAPPLAQSVTPSASSPSSQGFWLSATTGLPVQPGISSPPHTAPTPPPGAGMSDPEKLSVTPG